VAVVDFETDDASHTWVAPHNTLSARHIVTDILPAMKGLTYDVVGRVPVQSGSPVPFTDPGPWDPDLLQAPGPGALILGGDVSADNTGADLAPFVDRAAASGKDKIIAAFAGYAHPALASEAASHYKRELRSAGWTRTIQVVISPGDKFPSGSLGTTAGVLIVGGNQRFMGGPLADDEFRDFVEGAITDAPVVMTDRAATAVMGDWYVANQDPRPANREADAIADFRSGNADVTAGLHIIPGVAFEPRLSEDSRWGRLYGVSMDRPSAIVFGICQLSTLVLEGHTATVGGERSVVSVDGRLATFGTGTNGAITALGVVLNVFSRGDEVGDS
jgi:cyanophycinase-like exopeptidase